MLIDGGQGQLNAAREVLAALGAEVPLVAIAKGPDRDAGRETFFLPGRDSFKLPPRDPVLYFVERLRDEAHRFAIGSHRARRMRDLREAGLQEIAGIGPTRKRALLHHFGTLKAIERASVTDLMQVDASAPKRRGAFTNFSTRERRERNSKRRAGKGRRRTSREAGMRFEALSALPGQRYGTGHEFDHRRPPAGCVRIRSRLPTS